MTTIAPTFRPRANFGRLAVHLVLLLLSLLALAPFAMLISSSLSSEAALGTYGYALFPKEVSLEAYRFLFADASQLLRSYGVSIFVTVVGGGLGLLVMSLLAYALSRKDFGPRMPLAFFVFFTMLFNGGLVPWYILITQYLHLRNTIWVLILPHLVVPWYVLLLRTYFAGLPSELLEAARIDGASEWRIFFRIALPLSAPALATVGLFHVLSYWNDWWLALLFIDDRKLVPLQYLMYIIQS
ncbi:MAG TPA: carbohydrate ABC transporter permease, partial [Roseiflexaceae bacterium]|nr:carbohydrate ABC transporter permease [Roseiflexaceae bacterium]